MSESAAKLLEQLLTLPEAERAEIADRLWDSLPAGSVTDDPEFHAELERRLASVADGTAELIDGEHFFREARERLARKRLPPPTA
jgi:putative addiction module component (TIGR02574 family)